ncbi:MAG: UDP-N-acetylglucosamine 2-epimerase [Candidatus Omnitrophica bacterium]|nr:UDP-N-acetylglucosamine 2-epimerase [Candidatus Omnitrophota bacterium]
MQDLIFLKSKLKKFLAQNSSQKKVLVINGFDKIGEFAAAIEDNLDHFGNNTEILCFKARIPEEFAGFSDYVKVSEDYLADEDYTGIDHHVFNEVSQNWDKAVSGEYRELFTYRGVELARFADYDLQLFLLLKVKASLVFERAMKKENYKAFFIMDSTGELNGFDSFLSAHYHIRADLVKIQKQSSVRNFVKMQISESISNVLDKLAGYFIRKKGPIKLIDARLYGELGIKEKKGFILAPIEEGMRLRLKCLFKNRGYISFRMGESERKRLAVPPVEFKDFDTQSLAKLFFLDGVNYWALVEDKIITLIFHDFVRFRRNIDTFLMVENAYNIKATILRNDIRELEKTLVSVSKKNDIPTLVIQHGILAEPNGHNVILADKIAVWGNRAVSWYEKFDNGPSKTEAIGNPSFDALTKPMRLDKNKYIQNALKLSRKKYLSTLITPCTEVHRFSSFETDDVSYNLIKHAIKAVKSIGEMNLVVKLHPNQNIRAFMELFKKEDKNYVIFVHKTNLHKLIAASDVVMTPDSTVGLEAVIMQKPVVAINLGKRPSLLPFTENGVALGVYKGDDIKNAIEKALHDKEVKKSMELARKDFVNDFVYKLDGKCRERVRKLIKDF